MIVFKSHLDDPTLFNEFNMLGDETCDISHPRSDDQKLFKELHMLGDETCDISHPRVP
jgi:hypothetical protein